MFFPPLAYLTPKVKYTTSPPCADQPARKLEIAIVGSQLHPSARRYFDRAQLPLARLNFYYYARLGRFGGVPYRELQRSLGDNDLAALGNVNFMIIEENEFLIGRSSYVDEVLRVVGR